MPWCNHLINKWEWFIVQPFLGAAAPISPVPFLPYDFVTIYLTYAMQTIVDSISYLAGLPGPNGAWHRLTSC